MEEEKSIRFSISEKLEDLIDKSNNGVISLPDFTEELEEITKECREQYNDIEENEEGMTEEENILFVELLENHCPACGSPVSYATQCNQCN